MQSQSTKTLAVFLFLLLGISLQREARAGAACDLYIKNGGTQLNNGSCVDGARAEAAYTILAKDQNLNTELSSENVATILKGAIEFRLGAFVPNQEVVLGSLCTYLFRSQTSPYIVTNVLLTEATRKKLLPLFGALKLDREYGDYVNCRHMQGAGVACYQSTYGLDYQCI